MIFKLTNVIQNYAWGSRTALNTLFGFDNPNNEPQAELWMGAHPSGGSHLGALDVSLADYVAKEPTRVLGNYTATRYGELPYLFKILAADTPLSIQVHPNKRNSELGFERENAQGIELTAANRNYKDPNHKPELVYAISVYKAMNGFRPFDDILALLAEIPMPALASEVEAFKLSPNADGLKSLFTTLLTLEGDKQQQVLAQLTDSYGRADVSVMTKQALEYSEHFSKLYPGDNGLLAPLILNVVELQPGEAMFLHAETPHAYVQGTALEVMASSDNVLRAGLTPKHIDVKELVANTCFEPIPPSHLLTEPLKREGYLHFPVPVDDFRFDVLDASDAKKRVFVRSAEVVFCIEGEVTVNSHHKQVTLQPGESVFIPCEAMEYTCYGKGRLARVSN
ncbi:mannose-6-phosphate isomerase, class I [Aeromonas caviae]|uniref:mannose-6-phosphate isomerase, class I n=1 Tax=Aeromonas caviae TaxID=648 RepID=UPI0028DE3692|nr:mannose-6-phosphate isomerase, class I [Aeromonas caviae]MDT8953433.1 mannose-6-phosphate isomerase, class I [Aeromonas caviae]